MFFNERTENHTLYSNIALCNWSVYFYVSLVQEQKHQQFISLVLHLKCMWVYYSVQTQDVPMIFRSSTEISLLVISSVYIIRNKMVEHKQQILPG